MAITLPSWTRGSCLGASKLPVEQANHAALWNQILEHRRAGQCLARVAAQPRSLLLAFRYGRRNDLAGARRAGPTTFRPHPGTVHTVHTIRRLRGKEWPYGSGATHGRNEHSVSAALRAWPHFLVGRVSGRVAPRKLQGIVNNSVESLARGSSAPPASASWACERAPP